MRGSQNMGFWIELLPSFYVLHQDMFAPGLRYHCQKTINTWPQELWNTYWPRKFFGSSREGSGHEQLQGCGAQGTPGGQAGPWLVYTCWVPGSVTTQCPAHEGLSSCTNSFFFKKENHNLNLIMRKQSDTPRIGGIL